jgi:hypothetical protein
MLDLNPKSAANLGGLLLPNVFITNRDSLPVGLMGSFSPAERDVNMTLQGLVVFNSNPAIAGGNGIGVYIWDGNIWRHSSCTPASISTYLPLSKTDTTVVSLSINLSIIAEGGPTLTYQWYLNTTASNSGGTLISGATASSYSTPTSLTAGTYYYYCVVTNYCDNSSAVSDVFTIEIMPVGIGTLSGKTCFDINQSNFTADCGLEATRASEAVDFSTLGAVTYTFTTTGLVKNVRYTIVDDYICVTSAKYGTIAMSGNTGTISVDYITECVVGGSIYGRTSDNAVQVKINVIYFNGLEDVQVSLTANIQDCLCCPGLLIPGGEYSDIAMSSYLPPGSHTYNSDGSAIEALRPAFTATGKDLCYYYRDYRDTANTVNSKYITWNTATKVCGASDGKGVDDVHSASAWRLPVLMELAQIGQLVSNNTDGASGGTLTQAMANTAMTYTNGKLPSGSAVTVATVYNFDNIYWSSTQASDTEVWTWIFRNNLRNARKVSILSGISARCVRSYY